MSVYRINYGNGQVSDSTFSTRKLAIAHINTLQMYRAFAFIQMRDGGEWHAIRLNKAELKGLVE